MTELLAGGSAWWVVPVSLLVFGATFGLLPGLMLRLLVLLYPRDDPRRQELFGELYAPGMGRIRRFEWVFQQLETALRDGLGSRREAGRQRKKARNREAAVQRARKREAATTASDNRHRWLRLGLIPSSDDPPPPIEEEKEHYSSSYIHYGVTPLFPGRRDITVRRADFGQPSNKSRRSQP